MQTLAYPFDVVRRRLQVSGWSGAKNLHAGVGVLLRRGCRVLPVLDNLAFRLRVARLLAAAEVVMLCSLPCLL
jgi:hypothetical protein